MRWIERTRKKIDMKIKIETGRGKEKDVYVKWI